MSTEEKEDELVGLDLVKDDALAAIVNEAGGDLKWPYQVAAFEELARRSGHQI